MALENMDRIRFELYIPAVAPQDSSRSIWWHTLVVIIPSDVQYPNTPFLWIAGGSNDNDDIPEPTDEDSIVAGTFAVGTKTIGAALFKIPNTPIVFYGDPLNKTRREEGIIAYTWWHHIFDPEANYEWLLRLPMTKAAVRAMDTVAAFMSSEYSPQEIQDIQSNPSQMDGILRWSSLRWPKAL